MLRIRPRGAVLRVLTEQRPFHDLRPGDHVVVPHGIVQVDRVDIGTETAVITTSQGEAVTGHRSNWPSVVTSLRPDGSPRFVPCRLVDGEIVPC